MASSPGLIVCRAPGAPQVAFAVESHIDMVAHEMGLDPLEMRQRNAIVDGDLTPLGETRRHLRCHETIEAGARTFGWDKPKPPHIGRGISISEQRLRSRLQRPAADDDDRTGDRSRRRYDEAGTDGTRRGAA